MTKLIAVHKEGFEGGIHIDAQTGQVVTPADQQPEWSNGYAVALLAERTGWYEKQVGAFLPSNLLRPEILSANDLGWIGLDEAHDEVEIEADLDYRMEQLESLISTTTTLAEHEMAHSYSTNPTSEETLEQAEGVQFEAIKTAVAN